MERRIVICDCGCKKQATEIELPFCLKVHQGATIFDPNIVALRLKRDFHFLDIFHLSRWVSGVREFFNRSSNIVRENVAEERVEKFSEDYPDISI